MTLAVAFRRKPDGPFVREARRRWVQVDGETRVLARENDRPGAPTAVVVHGLTSDADTALSVGYARALYERGFRTVRLNQRNFGGTELDTPTLSHAGLVDDLAALVRDLVAERPGAPIYLTGFSMGGNVCLRYLGLGLAPDEVKAAAVTAPAVDLGAASRALPWVYDRYFVRELTSLYVRKAAHFADRYDPGRMRGVRSVRAFDEAAVVPGFGFEDVDDYYHRASSLPVLGRVDRPCLVLVADDDPIVPAHSFDAPVFQRPELQVQRTRSGGHVGWIASGWRYWAERRIASWLGDLAFD